jgi:regulation of enolase protein 1 (concanavalin A-like superfamily)
MRHQLVAKQFIHLFKGLALRLWEQERIAKGCEYVESEEEIEKSETHIGQSDWSALSEEKVQAPIR